MGSTLETAIRAANTDTVGVEVVATIAAGTLGNVAGSTSLAVAVTVTLFAGDLTDSGGAGAGEDVSESAVIAVLVVVAGSHID